MESEELTITVGGEKIGLPILNFAALRRVWPILRGLADKADPVDQAEALLAIVAEAIAGTRPDLRAVNIAERLSGREFADLLAVIPKLLAASGLVVPKEPDTGLAATGGFDGDFDRWIAELATAGIEGGSWDRIECSMTLPRFMALRRYWTRFPPAHVLLAGRFGMSETPEAGSSDLGALVAMLGGGAGRTVPIG